MYLHKARYSVAPKTPANPVPLDQAFTHSLGNRFKYPKARLKIAKSYNSCNIYKLDYFSPNDELVPAKTIDTNATQKFGAKATPSKPTYTCNNI